MGAFNFGLLVRSCIVEYSPPAYNIFAFLAVCRVCMSSEAPYPVSPVVAGLTWEDETIVCGRSGSGDNWPITWVDDDLCITAWGDGPGFDGPTSRDAGLSLGFARISGNPPQVRGEDFATSVDTPEGGGSSGIKASGLLMVDGVLYMFARNYKPPGSNDFTNAILASSRDRGKSWQWADWHFADTFGCPEFVQFGPSYAGARDDYVYIASQSNDSAYGYSPDIVLASLHDPAGQSPERLLARYIDAMRHPLVSIWAMPLERSSGRVRAVW